MLHQIFLSPQEKRYAIITYKHGIYELPHELPNDLRLTKLGNIRKVSKPHRMIAQRPAPSAQPPCQNESFVNTRRKLLDGKQKLNLSRCALFHMKTRVSFKYLVSYYRLIRICRIQWWCSLFLFYARNILFGKRR